MGNKNTRFILSFKQSIPQGKAYKMIICYATKPGAPPYSEDNGSANQATARHFLEMPIKRIVSSPLKRAKETALIIAKETNTTISEDIRLRRSIH
ncbi:Histidine phosphatase superfamily (branch 1) [Paenibacillus sp. yr247]|uniref:histidine phosphatase family protein n=1 Tax=Paenibacillus sp. yr247 TaxID=1761880 RepID=UPI000889D5C5|nr:histidine phosphatase family protein [Paenibacillus sp. yr247]SDP08446.1 Histidine phosphatase superfamily (branch 1) [Paenibacillus sp. yr247]